MNQPEPLDPALCRDVVSRALAEDVGNGDVTTLGLIPADRLAHGVLLAKSCCVIAGLDLAVEAFHQLNAQVEIITHRQDGALCHAGDVVAELHGHARALLSAERTALNFLQRLSGIATLTWRFVDLSQGRIVVLDTRKTTPTLRALEKYAVRAGGGTNHRFGLDDAILIKENHIRLAGGMSRALARMAQGAAGRPIEVEAETLTEVDAALDAGVTRILVDNMSIEDIRESVRRSRGRALIEISGGVTLERMPALAESGADFVSIGALTHSAPAADLSLELYPDQEIG